MKGRYYQGFIPPKPGELFKIATQEIEDKELSKEEFREYILNLTAKYETYNNQNNTKQQSKAAGITTATLSDYCEIEEDTREDLESDSMNSARYQQPISNRNEQIPKIGYSNSQTGPQFKMHYTLLKDQLNRDKIIKNQPSSNQYYYSSKLSQNPTHNSTLNNESNSYYYNTQQLPNVPRQTEGPQITVPVEDQYKDYYQQSKELNGKSKQSKQYSSATNLHRLMRGVQAPSGSKISQMRFFNSKRAIFSSHSQKSDRSSGLSSVGGNGGGCCLTTNSTMNQISTRVIDSSNSNRSRSHLNNYSFNKTMEIKKDTNNSSNNNNNSSSSKAFQIEQKQLRNLLFPLKNVNSNESSITQGLFMEVQGLKFQRNQIENSTKTIKERITLLEKDLRQTRKQLYSWGFKAQTHEERLDGEWRQYDQQLRQLELRDEKIEKIYEDPNFYYFSFRAKAREMNETIKELDETISIQRDMVRKLGLEGQDQERKKCEIQLAEKFFELFELEEGLIPRQGSSEIQGSSEVQSLTVKREQLLKDLVSMKSQIQTLQTEIAIRQTTNVSFEKSIDALASQKTKRDAEIQELKPKVDALRRQFKEIQENRKRQAQWWKQQDQQLEEMDEKGRKEERIRSSSGNNEEDKDSLRNEGKTMQNRNGDDVGFQDGRYHQKEDFHNHTQEDEVLMRQKPNMGMNPQVRNQPYKSRTQRQVEQIHRQSSQLNELKLEYQLFRGAQMFEQQNWNGKRMKEQGEIIKLKEMNAKLMNSIVKKKKLLKEFEKQKEKEGKNKIQEFQGNKEKEIKGEGEEEGIHGNDRQTHKASEQPYFTSLKVIQQQKLQLQQQDQYSIVSREDLTQTTQQGQKTVNVSSNNNDSIVILPPTSGQILNSIEPSQGNIEQSLCSDSCNGVFGDNLHFSGDEGDDH